MQKQDRRLDESFKKLQLKYYQIIKFAITNFNFFLFDILNYHPSGNLLPRYFSYKFM